MTKNNTTKNVIVRRLAAVVTSFAITAFGAVPVHADSYLFNYLDNGDISIYESEQGVYVDADTYHAFFGIEYDPIRRAYGFWSDGMFQVCTCTVCETMSTGHIVVVPRQENNSAGEAANSTEQNQTPAVIHMLGGELGESNLSGEGWSYNQATGKLTLDSFNYEGTGLFTDPADADVDDEASDEGYDEDDEAWDDDEDEDWDDEDDSEDDEDDTEEDEESTSAEPVKGVIRSDGNLTLVLNGASHITVTDDGSDAGYAVNPTGELNIEGDGVLYVKSATEEKVYGTEPTEDDGTAGGNSGNIITNDIDNNNNNSSNNSSVNNQTVNEAPMTQNFSPSINIELPQNSVTETVLSGTQQRHPELATPSAHGKIASIEKDSNATGSDVPVVDTADDGEKSASPETADRMDLGLLTSLVAMIIMGVIGGGILIRKRLLERR